MQWSEFKTTETFSTYVKACLMDLDWTKQCWEGADDLRDFYKRFFATTSREIITSPAYAGLSKMMSRSEHNEHCRLMLSEADQRLVTDSDRASLKVGNNDFSVLIPTDNGDGETRTYIFKKGNEWFNDELLDGCQYLTCVEGDFNIYENDCDGKALHELSGKYFVYRANNNKIIFNEWE